jgi:hypothetical protein
MVAVILTSGVRASSTRVPFSPPELRGLQRIVEENRYTLLEQWDAHFGV